MKTKRDVFEQVLEEWFVIPTEARSSLNLDEWLRVYDAAADDTPPRPSVHEIAIGLIMNEGTKGSRSEMFEFSAFAYAMAEQAYNAGMEWEARQEQNRMLRDVNTAISIDPDFHKRQDELIKNWSAGHNK